MRHLSMLDNLLCEVDMMLRTVFVPSQRSSTRESPAAKQTTQPLLSKEEKRHVAGLMRVNHAGEVCAQALYQGQAFTAQLTHIKAQMVNAAAEEVDHLAWCEQRLCELESRPSILNPLWYAGSLMLGALAGLAGDRWSLGFVAETERQVAAHLEKHLAQLPSQDTKTKAILTQMQKDESHHAMIAQEAGAAEFPFLIKQLMYVASKIMTNSSYYY